MYDTRKLRGRIIEIFGTLHDFAEAIGRTRAYVSNILKGKRYLRQQDIELWAEKLEIAPTEIALYFFTRKVCETEQKGE
jgi:transcriptional regulator with XRE-family HTH domain